ncbi:MAG: hypothetical protein ABSC18_00375 [Verrucomicrobiota bacterium]
MKIYNCKFSICYCLASWRLGDKSPFIREISRSGIGMVPHFACGGPLRAFFRFTMGWQDAQVANDEGLGRICLNPRFSLDSSRLYANLLCVTIGRRGPGGGGKKIPLSRAFPEVRLFQRISPKTRNFNVKAANPPFDRIQADSSGFKQIQPKKYGKNHERYRRQSAMNLGRQEAPKAQPSGVAHREIREIRESRVACVRVFRVVRGEEASFLSLLSLFAANQWKYLSMNHLHATRSFSGQA